METTSVAEQHNRHFDCFVAQRKAIRSMGGACSYPVEPIPNVFFASDGSQSVATIIEGTLAKSKMTKYVLSIGGKKDAKVVYA